MTKRILTYLVVSLMFTLPFRVFAQDGRTAYNFLNTTTSSHAYGLGGTNISIIDDDINLYEQNPALLGSEVDMQLGFSYMRYLGGSNYASVRFGKEAGERAAWAAGVQYFGYGKMDGYDEAGIQTGTFNPRDIVVTGSYSHDLSERVRGGASIKMIQSSYEQYNAFAIGVDLGVNYYNPDKDLSLSAVAKNLGGQVKRFADSYDRLPWDIQLGYTQSLHNGPFRVSITANNLTKWKLPYYKRVDDNDPNSALELKENFASNLFRHLIFALEYAPSEKFYIGLGYNHKTKTDMTTASRNFLSGFSAAAGLNTQKLRVGIAFAQPHIGGTTFMVNFSTNLYEFK